MKKRILILGLVTVYLSMAVACNKGGNSGSMADNNGQGHSSAQDNNNGIVNDNNLSASNDSGTTNNNGITGTGGANPNDNISLVDDAENVLDDIVDDAVDGVSDLLEKENR